MRRCLVVLGMLITGPAPSAAAAAATRYDLAACIRAALAHSVDLHAAAADLAQARARLQEARAGRYGEPEYTQVVGLVNRARGNPVFSPDSKNDVFNGLGPFTRIDLDVNIPLWTFGKLDAALRAAQKGIEGEEARGEAARAEVVLGTKQLYYGLLLSRQLSGVLHDMLDAMDKAVKKAEERLQSGSTSVTEIDVLKLKVGRAKFAKGVLEVDASADLTRSALSRAVGVDPDSDFDIADRKLEPAPATLAPLQAYLADGPGQRPEARQLVSGVAAQSARVDVERADFYPTLFLLTGFQFARAGNRTEQSNPFANDDFNYVRPLGVVGMHWNLNFPLTDAKVEQARADLARLQAEQRDAASGMALEIRRAYSDVVQARDTIATAQEGRKAGRGLLILSLTNFDLGIGEAEELFKGLGSYTEAATDYFRAVHDYDVALATLSKATGREVTTLRY